MIKENPMILLSLINTKLRDVYSNLDELCDDLDESKEEIESILNRIGYFYEENLNQFKSK